MEDTEIILSGIGISKSVITTIVSAAAERVTGVARVGGNDIASSLISVFTSKTVQGGTKPAVIETGATIQGPKYLNQGERIKVDTRTGKFVQRL